ncbi:bacteriohemerythrin [Shewanella sp. UCD-KL12]|uniref:bacteriohemerythrin n=1 Tax=Shewanella sp. UCD-KL12 TaxID=1917163 RepID=UPI0009706E4C|nr:bacteriohemerythrin [Shewanella sp. UCD-KL12]
MHTYTWLESYDLGIEVIDSQHKNLLVMINKLLINQNESRGIMQRLIKEVIAYAEYHFIYEENLMMLTRYEDFERHSNVHNMLLRQLKNQCSKYINDQCELKIVIIFMANWLIEHILSEDNDRDLAKYLLSSEKYNYLINI